MPSTTLAAPGSRTRRVEELDQLGAAGRLAAYRAGELGIDQLSAWATRYPDEVPTVNGEVEWIGLTLADLD
jgi:hypothetical protein